MGHIFSIGIGRGQRESSLNRVHYQRFHMLTWCFKLLHSSPQMVYGTIART